VVGIKQLPAALSLTWIVLSVPATFSEAIALEIAQATSVGYLGTQLFAGFMYVAAACSMYAVRMWKVGDLKQERILNSGHSSHEAMINEKVAPVSWKQRLFALEKV